MSKFSKTKDNNLNVSQRVYKDLGFNSGVSHLRKGKKLQKTPCGVAIPGNNILEGENSTVDNIFKKFTIAQEHYCPWIWGNMSEKRVLELANTMMQKSIIESLRIS